VQAGSILKSSILKDITLFVAVLLFLFVVIPIISSIFKQLIILQVLILAVTTIALTYIVHRVRSKGRK
tara:strand:- start:405 stop:608 length:204 start_codon:yes stop_codon:yes gene_type:complete